MMENKTFRWIACGVSASLAIIAIVLGTITGFLCFIVAALMLFPFNRIPEKLDTIIDPKYRKRTTITTIAIFFACGLLAFTTANKGSPSTDNTKESNTTTTAVTTTAITTTETTETTKKTMASTTETTVVTTEKTTADEHKITTVVSIKTETTLAMQTEVAETTPPTEAAPIESPTDAPTNPPANNSPTQNSKTVYVTPTGKCYHYSSNCNGGKYIESTLDDALRRGLSPCKKCVG